MNLKISPYLSLHFWFVKALLEFIIRHNTFNFHFGDMNIMKRRRYLVTALLATVIFGAETAVMTAQQPIKDLKPTVILVSLDGFRYDYLDKYSAPELNKLAKEGVRAKWMIPSFPTKTFPNHYAIATGLYPEHNGIVENNIWDFGTVFTMGKQEEVQNGRWWLGEPIWVTAEKQGQHAGAFFFPGTEADIGGIRPSIWKHYDGKIPNPERVDTLLGWLDLPKDKRPTMLTLYFSDTDDSGHASSPDSDETRAAVAKVDGDIKRLVDGLNARHIRDKVNLIIVSDHGMAPVDQRNAVIMDDHLDRKLLERDPLTTGEIWQIFPKAGETDNVMAGLSKAEHTTCWRKADIPARLNYNEGRRIAPVICSSDLGWAMTTRERFESSQKRADFSTTRGAHGYDNRYMEMQAIFIAHGKAFKKKKVVAPFENVEVYNIMCKILGLNPAKNDGDLNRVPGLLR